MFNTPLLHACSKDESFNNDDDDDDDDDLFVNCDIFTWLPTSKSTSSSWGGVGVENSEGDSSVMELLRRDCRGMINL